MLQTLPLDSPLLTQPFALFQCLNAPEQATCGGEDAAAAAAAASAEGAAGTCKGVCGYSYLLGELDGPNPDCSPTLIPALLCLITCCFRMQQGMHSSKGWLLILKEKSLMCMSCRCTHAHTIPV